MDAQRKYNKVVSFYPINSSYVPIYGAAKYIVSETNDTKPYIQLAVGYAIGINKQRFEFQSEYSTENGLFGQVQLGTSISVRGKYNFVVSLNLNVQSTKGNLSGLDWNANLPFSSSFDLVMIRPGFSPYVAWCTVEEQNGEHKSEAKKRSGEQNR